MFVIGLTGGIGSGKSAVTSLFADLGVDVIDADVAAREVVKKGTHALEQIAEHFGDDILQEDGTLDRAALRKIVFSQPKERGWLESLLFPLIFREIQNQVKHSNSDYAILVSPLLVETGQNRLTQRILVVDAPEELQIERATSRDSNSEEQIRSIMSTQASREHRLSYADDIITNDKGFDELAEAVRELHQQYITLAKQA